MTPLDRFLAATGTYRGHGQYFEVDSATGRIEARLEVTSAIDGAGASLHLEAADSEGGVVHEEQMLVARDRAGGLYLWGLDSDTGRIRRHKLAADDRQKGRQRFVFTFGRSPEVDTERKEIVFEFAGGRIDVEFGPGAAAGDAQFQASFVPVGLDEDSEVIEGPGVDFRAFEQLPDEPLRQKIERLHGSIFDGTQLDLQTTWEVRTSPHLVCAFNGERPVGFKLGYQDKSGRFYSWLGGVDPVYRRRGIGSELLRRQHAWAAEQGYESVRTKPKNQWRGMMILNLKHGFDIIGTYTDEHGATKIILQKLLTD